MINRNVWSDHPELVESLKAHYAANLSAGMIAQRLNDRFSTDFSRNAIIGKLNRLGLRRSIAGTRENAPKISIRRTTYRAVEAINQAIAGRPLPHIDPAKAPDPTPLDPATFAVTFAQLADPHCRWPVQDEPFLFCGAPKIFESSYCAHHHAIAYRPPHPVGLAPEEIARRRQMAQRNFRQMRVG